MAVRKEEIRIHAVSNVAQVAARDAAALRLLASSADGFSSSAVQTDRDTQRMNRSLSQVDSSASGATRGLRRSSDSINQLTGRIRVLADVAAILGPALVPIGALAVPAVAGLANQLGFAAAAGGTAILAFQGVGDAVTAMNEAAVDPSAANLEKMNAALAALSPQAQKFAQRVSEMRGQFRATRDAAAEGLFPELTPALDDLDGLMGRLQPVLRQIGQATGEVLADGLDSLNSQRWTEFFSFLGDQAKPVLSDLSATVGDFAHGLAELWMAFEPLNSDFSGWMRDVASSFDDWAGGLDQTQGFQDFIAYIRENGPRVADAAGAVGRAVLDIAEAAAPLGGPALAGIEAFAKVISAIADSNLGTPLLAAAAGMAALNRAMAVGNRLGSGGFLGTTRSNVTQLNSAWSSATQGVSRYGQAVRNAATQTSGINRVQATLGAAVGGAGAAADRASSSMRTLDTNTASAGTTAVSAGGGFKSLAKEAGAMGLIIGTISKGAEAYDIGMRGFASSTQEGATSVEDLQYKLEQTNLGKYASDFGIDISRLSEDLAKYGTEGEYVAMAQERINDALGSGFSGAAKGLGSFLNPMTTQYEKAYIAQNAFDQALRNHADLIGTVGQDTTRYGTQADFAGAAAQRAAQNVAQLTQQMQAQSTQALGAFDAQTAWGQAVQAARSQVAAGTKGLRASTEAGAANRAALGGLITQWNNFGPKVKNNVDRYRSARDTFLDVADGMGIASGRARQLWQRMAQVPKKIVTKTGLQGDREVNRQLNGMDNRLRELGRRRTRPKVDADTRAGRKTIQGMDNRLRQLDKRRVTPTLDSNSGPAMNKLRALEGANRRFGGSRWTGILDANNSPAVGKVGRTGSLLGNLSRQVTRPNIDANPAGALGKSAAVRGNLNSLGGMRPTPTVGLNDAASGPIAGIRGGLAGITSKTVTVTVVTRNVKANAAGGLYGDVANSHTAQMASGATTRVWGEPETRGESYIPHANDWRRPGARSILEQTAGILGGQVEWYAQGGMRAAERAGVEAAMRSGGGRQRVDARMGGRVYIDLSDGRSFPVELIEDVAQRVWDDNANGDRDFNAIHGRS